MSTTGTIASESSKAEHRASGAQPGWAEHLAALLVDGVSVEDAAREVVALGAPRDAVWEAALALKASPLLSVARVYWTRLCCREWLLGIYADLASSRSGDLSVIESRTDLSREDFLRDYYFTNTAVALPGIAKDWPARERWADRVYLSTHCGHCEVEVMMGRDNATAGEQNTAPRLKQAMKFSDYIGMVYEGPSNDHYLVARNHFFAHEGTRSLLHDVGPLPFVETSPESEGVRFWFGPAGTRTPLHYDDKNNVIIQVTGRKEVRLYPPCLSEFMAQNHRWYAGVDPAQLPDDAFGPAGRPREIRLSLGPGDGLFIPVGWWHALDASEISITLALVDFGVKNEYQSR